MIKTWVWCLSVKTINWEKLKTLDNKSVKPQNLMNYNVNFIDPSNIKVDKGLQN